MKNVEIVKEPYIYNGEFKTLNGDNINYCHLCVDVQIGDSIIKLKKPLRGLEKEYVQALLDDDYKDTK